METQEGFGRDVWKYKKGAKGKQEKPKQMERNTARNEIDTATEPAK